MKNLLEVNSPGHAQQGSGLNSSSSDLDCSGLLNTSESDDASTQVRSFDRPMVDSPGSSTSKTTTFDTQSLINQTILQQLTAIGERLDKIEQKTIKKTSGLHKSKSRSAVTKSTKVVRQSDSTHTGNHSARMQGNVIATHTVPSIVSIPHLTI